MAHRSRQAPRKARNSPAPPAPKRKRAAAAGARAESTASPASALLAWYDRNARDLPWRAPPQSGRRPDPYAVLISEVMLQQTTVAAVRPRFQRFLARWPDIAALAAAPVEDVVGEWAGLGYYARARNLHRAAREVVAQFGGVIPSTEEELRRLPGLGPYAAAAIAAIAFGRPAAVVDGNVERVVSRLHAIKTPPPGLKAEVRAHVAGMVPPARPGHFAEAMMDLGASLCTPRAPRCGECPLTEHCAARGLGAPDRFPTRPVRARRPERRGFVYVLTNGDGEALFERRPPAGLLGGLLGLPTSEWSAAAPQPAPPARARWRAAGRVRHVFTHFALELEVLAAPAPARFSPGDRVWLAPDAAALPTVMRKALDLALDLARDGAPKGLKKRANSAR